MLLQVLQRYPVPPSDSGLPGPSDVLEKLFSGLGGVGKALLGGNLGKFKISLMVPIEVPIHKFC